MMKVTFFSYQIPEEKISDILNKNPWMQVDNKNYELVIVLGGDGTFLSALKTFKDENVKVILLNQGRLGFFANQDELSLDELLNDNLFNNYQYLELKGNNNSYHAINEFMISTINNPIEYFVSLDSYPWYQFVGTGILISTTNGSSGMNRSLYGPLLLDNNLFIYQEFLPVRNSKTKNLNQPLVLSQNHKISLQFDSTNLNVKIDGLTESINANHLEFIVKNSVAKIYNFSHPQTWIENIKNKLL